MTAALTPSPFCAADIKAREGLRLVAYPDPVSGAEPWTCGYGCTAGVTKDTVWSMDEADQAFEQEYNKAVTGVSRFLPWAATLSPYRQDVLVQMAFQIGIGGLLAFKDTLANAEAGKFAAASADMLASRWAQQTPSRADALAKQFRTGVRA